MGGLQISLPNSAFNDVTLCLEISHSSSTYTVEIGKYYKPGFPPPRKRLNICQHTSLRLVCYRSKCFPNTLTFYFRKR